MLNARQIFSLRSLCRYQPALSPLAEAMLSRISEWKEITHSKLYLIREGWLIVTTPIRPGIYPFDQVEHLGDLCYGSRMPGLKCATFIASIISNLH